MAEAAYIYGVTRTPFGRYGGALAKTRPDDLAAGGRVNQELKQRGGRYVVASLCIGVGQGLALVLESC